MKYIVQCTETLQRRVRVGIEADSPVNAIKKAKALHDEANLLQDTAAVPLLLDEYDNCSNSLRYTVEHSLTADDPWPEPYGQIMARNQRDAAYQVAELLIYAYRRGEIRGGSIDWAELDLAYQAALEAASHREDPTYLKTSKHCSQLAVVLEGGIVQSVIADRPETAPAVAIIDYDIEDQEPEALSLITQSDGGQSKAYIVEPCIEPARIDLNEVFWPTDS